MRGLFITGTDTDVGKTHVAAKIAAELRQRQVRVGVYKPVASGCFTKDGELVSGDAIELWKGAGKPGRLEDVCPQRFVAPLAPHLAARQEGRSIDEEAIWRGFDLWNQHCDFLIVEGAGGLMSPITDNLYNLDLATRFGLPMVVIAANRLGAINATLLTLMVARSRLDQIPIAGVILNQVVPEEDLSAASNEQEIKLRAGAPFLAHVAHDGRLPENIDWWSLGSRSAN